MSKPDWKAAWEAAQDLLNLLQWHRGDPRLSSWEEEFLTSMVRLLQTYHGTVPLSASQRAKVNEVLDKLDAEPLPEEADLEDAE